MKRPRPTARRLQHRIAALGVAWLLLAAAACRSAGRADPAVPRPRDRAAGPAAEAPTGPCAPKARPTPPRGFRVEGLAAPGIDAIGLAGPAEGGFDQSLWAGSDGELILALLDRPSGRDREPAAARAHPPPADDRRADRRPGRARQRARGQRAERLLAMGDLEGASPCSTGCRRPARIRRSRAWSCRRPCCAATRRPPVSRAADIAPASDAAFWAKVTIYCRLVEGDQDGARLALDLLRDQGPDRRCGLLRPGRERSPTARRQPRRWGRAGRLRCMSPCYRLADLPLPRHGACARHRRSCWRRRRATRAWSATTASRWPSSAFLLGALSADGLAEQYRAAAGRLRTRTSLRQIETAWGPRHAGARLCRRCLEQASPASVRQVLDALWRAAQGSERFLIAELFAAPFAELPVERGRLRLAPSARPRPARGRAADSGGALVLAAERRCGRRPAGAR